MALLKVKLFSKYLLINLLQQMINSHNLCYKLQIRFLFNDYIKYNLTNPILNQIFWFCNPYFHLQFNSHLDGKQRYLFNLHEHYKNFNRRLELISNFLNKEVIICIHPNDNLEEKKKFFPNFKVKKYLTRDYIYKSKVVMLFFIFELGGRVDGCFILNSEII